MRKAMHILRRPLMLGVLTTWVIAWVASATLSYPRLWPRTNSVMLNVVSTDGDESRLFEAMHGFRFGAATCAWRYTSSYKGVSSVRSTTLVPPQSPLIPAWSALRSRAARDSAAQTTGDRFTPEVDVVAGWPMYALAGRFKPEYAPPGQIVQLSGSVIRLRDQSPRINVLLSYWLLGWLIPLKPLWPGFLVNTALYSMLWLLIFQGRRVVRRWRQRGVVLCGRCGYSLGGLPRGSACPECGTMSRG